MKYARNISKNTSIRRDPSAKEMILRRTAEPRLRVLLMPVAANGFPPSIGTPADDTLGCAQRSSGRAHIKEEHGLAVGVGLTRVVVNDISNLLLLAVDISCDVPVVSVKWRLGARKGLAMKFMSNRNVGRPTRTWKDKSNPGPASYVPWE